MCDIAEFYAEKLVKARKPHMCCETGRMIQPGEKYWSIAGTWGGDFRTFAQSEAAYHFARFLNGIGAPGLRSSRYDYCIAFGQVCEHVSECRDPELTAEWDRVCAGEVTRTTTQQEPK